MVMAAKTSLENKHLRLLLWFAIFSSCSHSTLMTKYATNGHVEAPLKKIQRMKDLLLCVHVVVFGRLRQRTMLTSVPHVQHDYFSSINQSDHCFLVLSLSLPLLKPGFH